MLVHICVTHPDLRGMQQHVADALHDVGDEISTVDDLYVSSPSAQRDVIDTVRQADALVCLIGPADDVRNDGTVPGEWEFDTAAAHGIPVVGYQSDSADDRSEPAVGRTGYTAARYAFFCSRLRGTTALTRASNGDGLPPRVLDDLEQIRARYRLVAPSPIRALHRRLRSHPRPSFDVLALSMQNMDTLYVVDSIHPNSEMAARLIGRMPGGAGANSAVALSRLGLSTAVAGAIGNDPKGTALRASLEDNEVNTDLLLTIDDVESGRGVVIRDRGGSYMNLIYGGANDRFVTELGRRAMNDAVIDIAGRSRIVHYTSFSNAAAHDYQEWLLDRLPTETVVTFKPSTMHAEYGADRLEAVLGRCDVLIASDQELDRLFELSAGYRRDGSLADRLDALFSWRHRRGFTRPLVVVVYLGLKDPGQRDLVVIGWGVDALDGTIGNDRMHSPSDAGILDATGARDAVAAGMLYGLLRGRTPVDCANLGYVLAMSAGAEYGCRPGLPPSGQVRDRWRQWMQVDEAPRWLDPYGYGSDGASVYRPMTA